MYNTLTNPLVTQSQAHSVYTCVNISHIGRGLFNSKISLDMMEAIIIPQGNTSKGKAFSLGSEYITNSLRLCPHLISSQLRKDFLAIS